MAWPSSESTWAARLRGPVPVREGTEIRISTRATPEVFAAVQTGKRFMSVECHVLREVRTPAGIREIQRAWVDAASLTDNPEYAQTRAEVRTAQGRRWWR